MNKINFEPIGKALRALDTDKIDIFRKMEIINPDGTTGETDITTPLYTNIPCHVSFVTADNPDTKTVDTQPIIVALKINCDLSVDLQNNDYIKAYKLSNNGDILEIYQGIIGEPEVTQSRKSAQMKMETNI